VEEESAKQTGGPCVLISSTKIPYKRKFLHLFKDGKLINPDVSDRGQSKCPMGFGNNSNNNNNNSNAGEEKAKCPFGHGSESMSSQFRILSKRVSLN
jgi:hypothetical protein